MPVTFDGVEYLSAPYTAYEVDLTNIPFPQEGGWSQTDFPTQFRADAAAGNALPHNPANPVVMAIRDVNGIIVNMVSILPNGMRQRYASCRMVNDRIVAGPVQAVNYSLLNAVAQAAQFASTSQLDMTVVSTVSYVDPVRVGTVTPAAATFTYSMGSKIKTWSRVDRNAGRNTPRVATTIRKIQFDILRKTYDFFMSRTQTHTIYIPDHMDTSEHTTGHWYLLLFKDGDNWTGIDYVPTSGSTHDYLIQAWLRANVLGRNERRVFALSSSTGIVMYHPNDYSVDRNSGYTLEDEHTGELVFPGFTFDSYGASSLQAVLRTHAGTSVQARSMSTDTVGTSAKMSRDLSSSAMDRTTFNGRMAPAHVSPTLMFRVRPFDINTLTFEADDLTPFETPLACWDCVPMTKGWGGRLLSETMLELLKVGVNHGDKVSKILLDPQFADPKTVNRITFNTITGEFAYSPATHLAGGSGREVFASEHLRHSARPGRVVRQMLRQDAQHLINDRDIELFTLLVDSCKTAPPRIELVTGEAIRRYYHYDTYAPGQGTLNNSCMAHARTQSYLSVYVQNPDVCSMAVMFNGHDQVTGRALVWTLTDGRKMMDRIYGTDQTQQQFIRWARENDIVDRSDVPYQDKKVQLTNWRFRAMPYMDTLSKLNQRIGVLACYDAGGRLTGRGGDWCVLTSTHGTDHEYFMGLAFAQGPSVPTATFRMAALRRNRANPDVVQVMAMVVESVSLRGARRTRTFAVANQNITNLTHVRFCHARTGTDIPYDMTVAPTWEPFYTPATWELRRFRAQDLLV